jgi:hypothetical protein
MTAPDTGTPITAADAAPNAPTAVQSAGQVIIDHLKTVGFQALKDVLPLIGVFVRQALASLERNMTGVAGSVERKVLSSVLDPLIDHFFGPAPTA